MTRAREESTLLSQREHRGKTDMSMVVAVDRNLLFLIGFVLTLVFQWSLWARNGLCCVVPGLVIFLSLSFIVGVTLVLPDKNFLQTQNSTTCFAFNVTRVRETPNDNSSCWYVDHTFVGYNPNNGTVVQVTNQTIFENYALIVDCEGSLNHSCSYRVWVRSSSRIRTLTSFHV